MNILKGKHKFPELIPKEKTNSSSDLNRTNKTHPPKKLEPCSISQVNSTTKPLRANNNI